MVRYPKSHKDDVRKRILGIASRQLRRGGIDNVSIGTVMADAGLTAGGFYHHFKSKDHLIEEVVSSLVDEALQEMQDLAVHGDIGAVIRRSMENGPRPHRHQSVMAIFACAPRQLSPHLDEVLDQNAKRIVEGIRACLPTRITDTRRHTLANALWSMLLGALQASRLMREPTVSRRLLADSFEQAVRLVTSPP